MSSQAGEGNGEISEDVVARVFFSGMSHPEREPKDE
jgi:hypothetical protein